MNFADTLASMVRGASGLFPAARSLTPISEDPPPGEGHFNLISTTRVGGREYYQPDPLKACQHSAEWKYALSMHGFINLHARDQAGLSPIYAGDRDALGLIPKEGINSDIVRRQAARLALFAFVGEYVLRTEQVPAPISDEAFLRMVNRSA